MDALDLAFESEQALLRANLDAAKTRPARDRTVPLGVGQATSNRWAPPNMLPALLPLLF